MRTFAFYFVLLVLCLVAQSTGQDILSSEEFVEAYRKSGYTAELYFVDYSDDKPRLARINPWHCSKIYYEHYFADFGPVEGRFPAGMGEWGVGGTIVNPVSTLYEVPGTGGWDIQVGQDCFPDHPGLLLDTGGEDLQPEVFGNLYVAFARENEEGGFDLAVWTYFMGVKLLELDLGDEMWPTFFYAAARGALGPDDMMNPARKPAIIVFQGNPDDAYQLYYTVLGPNAEVVKTGKLLDFEGEAMCPDIPNHYYKEVDYAHDGGCTLLAFHGLRDGNRDIYLTEITLHGDIEGDLEKVSLSASIPRRLTDWPGQEKFPELYSEVVPTTWCFFASDRDGDYDIYALWVEEGRFYQLTDMPGTQTAPFLMTTN